MAHAGDDTGEEIQREKQVGLAVERTMDRIHLLGHPLLHHHRRGAQPALLPLPDAETLRHRGLPQEAHLHHHGHHHDHLRHHPGTDHPDRHRAELPLPLHGLDAARRVCLAAGRDPDIAAAARKGRPDRQCLPYLRTPDRHRVHRDRLPYHPDTQRAGKPHSTADTAAVRPVAVVRHPKAQQ